MPNNWPQPSRRGLIAGLTGVLFSTAGCLGSSDGGPADTATASATATTDPATSTQTAHATETPQSTDDSDSINPEEEEATGPAEFSVTAIHTPEQAQIGVETPVEIEIKNVGGEAGTLTSGISFSRRTDSSPWTGIDETINMDFEAGETKTYSSKITWPFIETVYFRFDELHTTIEIEFLPRVLSRNETYQTPLGVELEVDEVGSQSHYLYTDREGTEQKNFPYEDDAKYLYVEVTATNVAEELVETPATQDFFVTDHVENGRHHSAEHIHHDGTDWKFPSEQRLNVGESASGKLLFKAEADAEAEALIFGTDKRLDEGTYEAYWTP